jgi:hypothetical protein
MAMLGQEIAPERKAKTSESAEKKDPAAEPADNNPLSNLPNPASLLKGLFGR